MAKAKFWKVRFLTEEGDLSSWDSQKARVYKIEQTFWNKTFPGLKTRIPAQAFLPGDLVQGRTADAVEFIRKHLDNQALISAWEAQPFYVAQPKPSERSLAGGRASKRRGRVYVGGNAPFWVLVHEIAHVIAPHGARHNWPFVMAYLELVKSVYGVKAYKALRSAFKKGKVRYKPTRSRAVSPERLAQLRANVAKARAIRMDKLLQDGPRLPPINI